MTAEARMREIAERYGEQHPDFDFLPHADQERIIAAMLVEIREVLLDECLRKPLAESIRKMLAEEASP